MLLLVGLYALVVRHIIPLAAALGKRHLDQIDTLIGNQKSANDTITKALQSIDRRLGVIDARRTVSQDIPHSYPHSPDRLT
ncbi:MAG: hypothetical protein EBR73_13555 [Rhodobacteraceae bacterium]|nr:hypothetical protein [Paracoccaceae bacterium]